MNNTFRRTTVAATLLAVTAITSSATASGEEPEGESVPFETLSIVSDTYGINLYAGQILRLGNDSDIEVAGRLLANGNDSPFVEAVVGSIDEVPAGTVVLIGVIDISCTPADKAGLVRREDGELAIFAPGHVEEEIECFAANTTVAVLQVDADDAPPGSADGAELVHFGLAELANRQDPMAVELTDDPEALTTLLAAGAEVPSLPPLANGVRRLAWTALGCALATVELWVTPAEVYPHFEQEDPHSVTICDAAQHYLAVFDIPAELVQPNAELAASIVR